MRSDGALSTARANTAAAYLTSRGLACATGKPRADTTGTSDPERLVSVKISYDHLGKAPAPGAWSGLPIRLSASGFA